MLRQGNERFSASVRFASTTVTDRHSAARPATTILWDPLPREAVEPGGKYPQFYYNVPTFLHRYDICICVLIKLYRQVHSFVKRNGLGLHSEFTSVMYQYFFIYQNTGG